MANTLSNHCTVVWVTQPEFPEGREGRSQADPKGRQLDVGAQRAPRLLVVIDIAFGISIGDGIE